MSHINYHRGETRRSVSRRVLRTWYASTKKSWVPYHQRTFRQQERISLFRDDERYLSPVRLYGWWQDT